MFGNSKRLPLQSIREAGREREGEKEEGIDLRPKRSARSDSKPCTPSLTLPVAKNGRGF
jgi:hypothetical protein